MTTHWWFIHAKPDCFARIGRVLVTGKRTRALLPFYAGWAPVYDMDDGFAVVMPDALREPCCRIIKHNTLRAAR